MLVYSVFLVEVLELRDKIDFFNLKCCLLEFENNVFYVILKKRKKKKRGYNY